MPSIPIIDLFAGPGGLGEGFSALRRDDGAQAFELAISIEKDPDAYRTLLLRAVYRRLLGTSSFRHYVDYIAGRIPLDKFEAIAAVARAFDEARLEVKKFELGVTTERLVDLSIKSALAGATDWVLIGGPPCQAYSLAGRARRANDVNFSKDVKHFLFTEYLRIIRKFKPAVFVMENVKGLLSSHHSGNSMFSRIMSDLTDPFDGVEYEVLSLSNPDDGSGLTPANYVIQAERFGVPQARHRVILLGVRRGLRKGPVPLLEPGREVTVADAIQDLPALRSRLSTGVDSASAWHRCLETAATAMKNHVQPRVSRRMRDAARHAKTHTMVGGGFLSDAEQRDLAFGLKYFVPARRRVKEYREWVLRPDIGGVAQHVARSHMATDLGRYLFAAAFAQELEISPRLREFPAVLLPEHKNVAQDGAYMPFQDRFRVQCSGGASTTIVSHIAKDGHYYIHYDPAQCRSLTVREAARLQTFPDDYFFEGNRTAQYTQVGNAVPPLLAYQIASAVHSLLKRDQGRTRASVPLAA